ncbi:hypothetical protein, partial [Acinetobacter baumannii]|uniref:hypothetical protein n=1 Tax=Acinetobacter baumannii TaxID=470 RepID=UPI0033962167
MLFERNLNALYDWSVTNKLPLNPQQCKMLRLGRGFDSTYYLGSQILEWTTSEKDLGVWVCG